VAEKRCGRTLAKAGGKSKVKKWKAAPFLRGLDREDSVTLSRELLTVRKKLGGIEEK